MLLLKTVAKTIIFWKILDGDPLKIAEMQRKLNQHGVIRENVSSDETSVKVFAVAVSDMPLNSSLAAVLWAERPALCPPASSPTQPMSRNISEWKA